MRKVKKMRKAKNMQSRITMSRITIVAKTVTMLSSLLMSVIVISQDTSNLTVSKSFIVLVSSTFIVLMADIVPKVWELLRERLALESKEPEKDTKRKAKDKYTNLSIVGILRIRKGNEMTNNMIILLLSLLGYSFLSNYLNHDPSRQIIYISLIAVLLLGLHKLVFDFRVKNGFYGNNEREAREIIEFILNEAENIDFTDNGKIKKIITDADFAELESFIKSSWVPRYS